LAAVGTRYRALRGPAVGWGNQGGTAERPFVPGDGGVFWFVRADC
jgi:hypothetical protein